MLDAIQHALDKFSFDNSEAKVDPKLLIDRAKDSLEEAELLGEEFENPFVRFVFVVQEIHNNNIVFLPISMATPDSLFDTLRIPRQVVIDDERAELKVDSFSARFSGDHDAAFSSVR